MCAACSRGERECIACSRVQGEKEDVLDQIRSLRRDVKLKDAIIASYVPPARQETIMRHAHWDDYAGTWTIDAADLAGASVRRHAEIAAAQTIHLHGRASPGAPALRLLLADRAAAPRAPCLRPSVIVQVQRSQWELH